MHRHAIVTGGAGAIGSRLTLALLKAGWDSVTVIDDLTSGYKWLVPQDERVSVVHGDVAEMASLGINGTGSDVFHLAAFFANQNSVDHPFADLHTNGKGTLAVLHWAANQQAKRVVYASAGCSIVGHAVDGAIREDMPVSMDLSTPYQITKALGEFYCNYFAPQVSTVRCRFFNSFGPGEVPGEYRNVIPNFIWRALHDEPLVITGTGEETRDFIFVDDLVDGLIRCSITDDAHGEAFNLGTGVETKVIDMARTIIDACGSSSDVQHAPRRAWDHSLRRQADVSKAGIALGFAPKVQFKVGIERTVAWFKENYDQIAGAIGNGH